TTAISSSTTSGPSTPFAPEAGASARLAALFWASPPEPELSPPELFPMIWPVSGSTDTPVVGVDPAPGVPVPFPAPGVLVLPPLPRGLPWPPWPPVPPPLPPVPPPVPPPPGVVAAHGPAPRLSQAGGSGAICASLFTFGWPATNVGLSQVLTSRRVMSTF